ncbi:MAG: hypothetical protein FJ315_02440 [SAR202 cluster bacterium]|nr:hypothetical protein [SAR202 cluster bacterium]
MGADLVTWALDQLGFKVNPALAWVILIVGSLLILAAGVGGVLVALKTVRGWFASKEETRRDSKHGWLERVPKLAIVVIAALVMVSIAVTKGNEIVLTVAALVITGMVIWAWQDTKGRKAN